MGSLSVLRCAAVGLHCGVGGSGLLGGGSATGLHGRGGRPSLRPCRPPPLFCCRPPLRRPHAERLLPCPSLLLPARVLGAAAGAAPCRNGLSKGRRAGCAASRGTARLGAGSSPPGSGPAAAGAVPHAPDPERVPEQHLLRGHPAERVCLKIYYFSTSHVSSAFNEDTLQNVCRGLHTRGTPAECARGVSTICTVCDTCTTCHDCIILDSPCMS